VLSNTSAYLGPAEYFDGRIAQLAHVADMRETAEGFVRNWFSQETIDRRLPAVDMFRKMVAETPAHGLAGCFAAVRDLDFRRTVALVDRPTLVIAGEYDTVTLPEHGEAIAGMIVGARYLSLPCVYLPNVESQQPFVEAVNAFLLEG